jgi:hypothetical protein
LAGLSWKTTIGACLNGYRVDGCQENLQLSGMLCLVDDSEIPPRGCWRHDDEVPA